MNGIISILTMTTAFILYFLPTAIATTRKNTGAIFVLNLFLGWTLLGWVGALIWALMDEKIN